MEIKSSSTPLNVDKFKNNIMSLESTSKKNGFSLHVDKYTVILIISIIAFIAGISFWIYVNYML